MFVNGPGDLGSISGRVIPKTQKMVLDASLLITQHYKVWIKGKVEQSWEGVAPSPTPWCSSYRKGSLWVTRDYGRQLYLLYTVRIDASSETAVKMRELKNITIGRSTSSHFTVRTQDSSKTTVKITNYKRLPLDRVHFHAFSKIDIKMTIKKMLPSYYTVKADFSKKTIVKMTES